LEQFAQFDACVAESHSETRSSSWSANHVCTNSTTYFTTSTNDTVSNDICGCFPNHNYNYHHYHEEDNSKTHNHDNDDHNTLHAAQEMQGQA